MSVHLAVFWTIVIRGRIVNRQLNRRPLFLGKPVERKIRDALSRGRIEGREDLNDIAWPPANFQITIHSSRASAVPEAVDAAARPFSQAVSLFFAASRIHFARGEQLPVL